MAQIPIELVTMGQVPSVDMAQAISTANSVQQEFHYALMSPFDAQPFKMLAYQKATAIEFLDQLEKRRKDIRGFHPFIIAVVDTELDGKVYSNLFGTHRAENGIAISSVANVEDAIIPRGRMSAYLLYYFARYTLSFIAPNHRNHEVPRDCVFDRKSYKPDITRSMKARAICNECRNALLTTENSLTPAQYEALDTMFKISGELLEGKSIDSVFISSPGEVVSTDTRAIKILFLAANPKDTDRLALDAEERAIDISLERSESFREFELKQHWGVRVEDLQHVLLRHSPDIVHFSGHGSNSSEIFLEDINGRSHAVPSEALSKLFFLLKKNIRCVVLNACYSQEQAEGIARSIDCVIGMSKAIGDDAAIVFAASFYQALGFGQDVETAFQLACNAIHLEGLNEQDTPKLLARNIDPQTVIFTRTR